MPQLSLRDRLAAQARAQRLSAMPVKGYAGEKPAWKVTFRRVVAFAIDCLALYAAGFAILFVGADRLYFVGEDGWWIGLCVGCLYFGFFDSCLGGGRTFGKRLMGIEVRKIDGSPLCPFDALLRFMPFAIIFAVNNFSQNAYPFSTIVIALNVLSGFIFFGIVVIGLSHLHRRSLHDILLDAVVVRRGEAFTLGPSSLKKPIVIFAFVSIILLGIQGGTMWYILTQTEVKKLVLLWEKLEARKDIHNPRVNLAVEFDKGRIADLDLVISVYAPRERLLNEYGYEGNLARSLRNYALSTNFVMKDTARLIIGVRRGVDIGIASMMETSSFVYKLTRDVKPIGS